jgi:hypothetical protein
MFKKARAVFDSAELDQLSDAMVTRKAEAVGDPAVTGSAAFDGR